MSMFEWIEIPDGYMMPGPHSTTAEGNRRGITTSSNYLLESDGECGLIDTGMRPHGLQKMIERIDASGYRLRWIVLTHFHYDHIGNADALACRYGCEVLAHPLDIPAIEDPMRVVDGSWIFPDAGVAPEEVSQELGEEPGDDSARRNYEKHFNFPVKVDGELKHNDELELGSWRLKVLNTPGHSPGSISLFNRVSRSLYIGDLDISMNPSRPWPIGSAAGLMESIRSVMELNASFLGPGHFLSVSGEWAVGEYLQDMLHRAMAIQHRVEMCLERMERPTVEQLAGEVFPIMDRYAYPPIHKHTVHCFLHKLQEEGKVRRILDEGEVRWEGVN